MMQRPGNRRGTGRMMRSNNRYRRGKWDWIYEIRERWPWAIPAAAAVLAGVIILVICLCAGGKKERGPIELAASTPAAAATVEPTATIEPTATPEPSATPEAVKAAPKTGVMIAEFEIFEDKLTTDVELGLQKCDRVDDSYFNDTVFIGDSVSEKLKYYVTQQRKGDEPDLLGNAVFLTAPSLSARNSLKDVSETSLHPTFRGEKMKIEDVVAKVGAKKVYIMLGLNDVGISGVKDAAKNLMTVIKAIKDKSPDTLIFIQSATPRVSGSHPNTTQLFKFNLKVYKYCLQIEDQGIYYVDVAHVMRDEDGTLFEDYCSDLDSMALHFNNKACKEWVEFLYTHALVD